MEYKIGEVIELDGIWYQFVQDNSNGCKSCVFGRSGFKCANPEDGVKCAKWIRKDGKSGHFVRLLPLGDVYEQGGAKWQQYKCIEKPNTEDKRVYIANTDSEVGLLVSIKLHELIEKIEQNQEDMEEKKASLPKEDNPLTRVVYAYVNGKISDKELIRSIKEMSDEYPYNKNNLKPFSLELAKQGKPVCTRDGRKARIICFDSKNDPQRPIIALVENNSNELLYEYTIKGKDHFSHISTTGTSDLMMLPEKKEGWTNVSKFKIYDSEEEALSHKTDDIISTIKVEWYE